MDFQKLVRDAEEHIKEREADAVKHLRLAQAHGTTVSNEALERAMSMIMDIAKTTAIVEIKRKYSNRPLPEPNPAKKLSDEFHDTTYTVLCGALSTFLVDNTTCDPTNVGQMLELARKTIEVNYTVNWMIKHGKDPTSGSEDSGPTGDESL